METSGAIHLPVTLAAAGSTAQLEKFLHLLQESEPRATVVKTVNESAGAAGADATSNAPAKPTLALTFDAFYTA